MNDPLTQLAKKYGTDRHPDSKHSYTPFYYELLKDKQESIKKVLEIGVGDGPGLRMWRDFFPSAQIYGAENDPKRIFKEERIQVFYCDQASQINLEGLVKIIGNDIDLVIDDGSHKPEDQIFTCLTLMPLLLPNTIYIIEDVADMTIVDKLKEYNLYIPKLQRKRERYDDYLIVVTK